MGNDHLGYPSPFPGGYISCDPYLGIGCRIACVCHPLEQTFSVAPFMNERLKLVTRALFLAGGWLLSAWWYYYWQVSGLRHLHPAISLTWLALVLGAGDAWALITFGKPPEVFVLTGLAAALGLVCIWRLRDWNVLVRWPG